jgi:hypothetical protein
MPRRSTTPHGKAQIEKLARSIDEFGFVMPILVDRSGAVIADHARLLAARQLGMAQVPTIELEHLSEKQIPAYASWAVANIVHVAFYRSVFLVIAHLGSAALPGRSAGG